MLARTEAGPQAYTLGPHLLVQFHPEAGPGPHDAWPILERWVADLVEAA